MQWTDLRVRKQVNDSCEEATGGERANAKPDRGVEGQAGRSIAARKAAPVVTVSARRLVA